MPVTAQAPTRTSSPSAIESGGLSTTFMPGRQPLRDLDAAAQIAADRDGTMMGMAVRPDRSDLRARRAEDQGVRRHPSQPPPCPATSNSTWRIAARLQRLAGIVGDELDVERAGLAVDRAGRADHFGLPLAPRIIGYGQSGVRPGFIEAE
jgi:hypothetical protein